MEEQAGARHHPPGRGSSLLGASAHPECPSHTCPEFVPDVAILHYVYLPSFCFAVYSYAQIKIHLVAKMKIEMVTTPMLARRTHTYVAGGQSPWNSQSGKWLCSFSCEANHEIPCSSASALLGIFPMKMTRCSHTQLSFRG